MRFELVSLSSPSRSISPLSLGPLRQSALTRRDALSSMTHLSRGSRAHAAARGEGRREGESHFRIGRVTRLETSGAKEERETLVATQKISERERKKKKKRNRFPPAASQHSFSPFEGLPSTPPGDKESNAPPSRDREQIPGQGARAQRRQDPAAAPTLDDHQLVVGLVVVVPCSQPSRLLEPDRHVARRPDRDFCGRSCCSGRNGAGLWGLQVGRLLRGR